MEKESEREAWPGAGPDGEKTYMHQFGVMVKSFISLSSDTHLAFRVSKHLQMNSSVIFQSSFQSIRYKSHEAGTLSYSHGTSSL